MQDAAYGRAETLGFLANADALTKAQGYLRGKTASQATSTAHAVRGAVEFFSTQPAERRGLFPLPEGAPPGTERLIERMLAGATLLDDAKLKEVDLIHGYEGVCATLKAGAETTGREYRPISRMRPLAHELRMCGWPVIDGPAARGYRLPETMDEVHDWGHRTVAKQKTNKERIERLELAKRLWYGGEDGGPSPIRAMLKHSSTPSPQSARLFGDEMVAKVKRQEKRSKSGQGKGGASHKRRETHRSGAAVIQR